VTEAEVRLFIEELRLGFPASKPQGDLDSEVALWMRDFGHVEPGEMAKAITEALDGSRYYPTLKEMRKRLERIGAVGLQREGCRCDGIGYYEAAPRQWIPCPACLPAAFRRWSEGHWAKDHWCEQCASVRRGDGPIQPVDERGLVEKPAGRKLTVDENLDRLKIMQQLVKEVAATRAADPKRYQRMTRSEIDKHWENRFNELMQGDSDVDPDVIALFNADPGVPVDADGFEVL